MEEASARSGGGKGKGPCDGAPRGRAVPEEPFTLEEAAEALPKVEALLSELRGALRDHRFAVEQVRDLRRMHGDEVEEENHEAHEDFEEHADDAAEAKAAMEEARDKLRDLGVEVRDARLGHVDFPARRDGEDVMLCWRDGEESVSAWHRRDERIADRRPLDRF